MSIEREENDGIKESELSDDFLDYVGCISSMCIDVIAGGITRQTFLSNLKIIIKKLEDD